MVLAPVFFSGRISDARLLCISVLSFCVFCAASSASYLLNDLADIKIDRADPRKKLRPLAAGEITPRIQKIMILIAAVAAVAGCAALPVGVAGMVGAYWVGMVLYTYLLKRIWPLGITIISLGMIARVFAGASAIDICVSPWVLPCVFFLTFYVVLGKRVYDSSNNGGKLPAYMKAVFYLCGLIIVLVYAFYSFYDVTMIKYHSHWIFLTTIPVAVGIWRYSKIVFNKIAIKEHLQAVVSDPLTAACLGVWFILFLSIIYFRI